MENKIRELIENTDLTLHNIAKKLGCSISKVRGVWTKYPKSYRKVRKSDCYRRSKTGNLNPMKGKYGDKHHYYKGVVGDSKGYLMVLKPDWYTGRKGSNHIFEHHYVVCKELGITEVPAGHCVHHCDHNPRNNSFDNLVLLTMSDHSALHSYLGSATTMAKASTLKWVEARNAQKSNDIV